MTSDPRQTPWIYRAARRLLLGASLAFLLVRWIGCATADTPIGDALGDAGGSVQDATADGAQHGDGSIDAGRDAGALDDEKDGSVIDAPVDSATDPAVDSATDAADAANATDAAHSGAALSFNAAGYVEVASAFVVPTTDFTLEAWVYPTSWPLAGNEMQILAKDQDRVGPNQYRLGIDTGGNVFFMASDASGTDTGFYNNAFVLQAPLTLDAWAHIAVTRSGSAFTLYVGSSAMATTTASVVLTGGTNPFRIGARVSQSGSLSPDTDDFQGAIDDVRVWSSARTIAEITAAMSQTVDPATNASLVANWRFDDGTGTAAADSTGSFPGALHVTSGSPSWTTITAY